MPESKFQPNWASPPGETIAAMLKARAMPIHEFCEITGLAEQQAVRLLNGHGSIDSKLAIRISACLGSTPRFWMDRERRFRANLRALECRRPALEEWLRSFPVSR